jgi:hypothetical protein
MKCENILASIRLEKGNKKDDLLVFNNFPTASRVSNVLTRYNIPHKAEYRIDYKLVEKYIFKGRDKEGGVK